MPWSCNLTGPLKSESTMPSHHPRVFRVFHIPNVPSLQPLGQRFSRCRNQREWLQRCWVLTREDSDSWHETPIFSQGEKHRRYSRDLLLCWLAAVVCTWGLVFETRKRVLIHESKRKERNMKRNIHTNLYFSAYLLSGVCVHHWPQREKHDYNLPTMRAVWGYPLLQLLFRGNTVRKDFSSWLYIHVDYLGSA